MKLHRPVVRATDFWKRCDKLFRSSKDWSEGAHAVLFIEFEDAPPKGPLPARAVLRADWDLDVHVHWVNETPDPVAMTGVVIICPLVAKRYDPSVFMYDSRADGNVVTLTAVSVLPKQAMEFTATFYLDHIDGHDNELISQYAKLMGAE